MYLADLSNSSPHLIRKKRQPPGSADAKFANGKGSYPNRRNRAAMDSPTTTVAVGNCDSTPTATTNGTNGSSGAGTHSLPRSFKLGFLSASQRPRPELFYDVNRDTLFVTKCVCLISSMPYVYYFRYISRSKTQLLVF